MVAQRLWSAGPAADLPLNRSWLAREAIESHATLKIALLPGAECRQSSVSRCLDEIAPDLTCAARIARLGLQRRRSEVLAAVVAGQRNPQFVIDTDFNIQAANTAALEQLGRTRRVTSVLGRLQLQNTKDHERLAKLVRRLAAGQPSGEPGLVVLRDGEDQIADLLVAAQCPELAGGSLGGFLIVSWIVINSLAPLSTVVLKDALGLTPAEANVANALASGLSVAKYALESDLSVATVRWHLHNAMQNSGANSQIELARLVLALQLIAR